LLLRDFYNWLASWIRLLENKNKTLSVPQGIERLISLWIVYAREYLGQTNFMGPGNVVKISYNRWVADEQYRACLLEQLAVPLKDNSTNHVPNVGGGSSFDGHTFGTDPGGMKLGDRWRYLLQNKFADAIRPIRDRMDDLRAYNEQIFDLPFPL
jgi:hypothetical protein